MENEKPPANEEIDTKIEELLKKSIKLMEEIMEDGKKNQKTI